MVEIICGEPPRDIPAGALMACGMPPGPESGLPTIDEDVVFATRDIGDVEVDPVRRVDA